MAAEKIRPAAPEPERLLKRAALAQAVARTYDQPRVDELCRAVGWALSNKQTFRGLVELHTEQGATGDIAGRMEERFQLRGILRDILRRGSVGVLEEFPERGTARYAQPVGCIASFLPDVSPVPAVGGQALFALKARDAIVFRPPRHTAVAVGNICEIIRCTLREQGAPEDLVQCAQDLSPAADAELWRDADLVVGPGEAAAAAGCGNAAMILDETADVIDACHNTMLSKTAGFGAGAAADGNLIVHASIFDAVRRQLEVEGGYLLNEQQREQVRAALWDEGGACNPATAALPAPMLAEAAGFSVPADRKFLFAHGGGIVPGNPFVREKRTTLLALFRYEGEFENALESLRALHAAGGAGHSVGIYSYNDEHIHRLGLAAGVPRVVVRQPQALAAVGCGGCGLPVTPALGCGVRGGAASSEELGLDHFLRFTWVSRPIAPETPPPEELFGDFYDPARDL